MPEGPEIWWTADSLGYALQDKSITDLHFAFDELKKFEEELKGKKVESV